MSPPIRQFAALVALLVPFVAHAALDLGTLAANYDGTRGTQYPTGNKPQGGGCTAPSGWTESDIGAGNGDVCDSSGTWSWQNIVGANSRESMHLVTKDAGSGDVQLVARINASNYTGNVVGYAGLVVGLRESTDASAWFLQCRVPAAASTSVDSIYRLTSTTFESSGGAAGQTQPRWCGVTYDQSADDFRTWESSDGSTWSQIQQITRDPSDVVAFLGGNSNSSSATLQAVSDNVTLSSTITIYTPSDPAPSAPVLVSSIPSQSAQQGESFSLALSAYFTGATSYGASGLPAGLSVNASTGLISGTPTGSGTSSVTATATNASGSTPTNFSIVVNSSSGDTFTIPAANTKANWNCNAASDWSGLGGSGTPGAGDTVVFGAGNHPERHFQNCDGDASARLTFRNDTAGAGPAIFRRTSTAFGGFSLRFSNTHYVTIDGTGKWVGAGPGTCGVNPITLEESTTSGTDYAGTGECGIVVTRTSSGIPNTHLKFSGFASNITVKGVEIHGRRTAPGEGGIGIEVKDQAAAYSRANNPGEFYENLLFEQIYIRDTNASGTYIGANWVQGNLPLRDVVQRYILVTGSGGRCFSLKSATEGDNEISDSRCYTSGLDGRNFTTGFGHCLQVSDGIGDVKRNIVTNCGENGIAVFVNATPASMFDSPSVVVENNIVHNVGVRGPGNGVGIRFDDTTTGGGGRIGMDITARYNTVDTTTHQCVQVDVGGSKSVSDSLLSNCGGTAVSGATATRVTTGSTGSMGYVNSGSDDFHITSGSSAKDQGGGTCPATDVDGETRPNGSACDRGADEYVP